jgi:glycosyltransferase involved in cell wall biosynthesis
MRICFVSHSSRNGGAERVLLETIDILQMHGVECKVLLPDRGEFCAELDRIGVPFSVMSFPLWTNRGEVPLFSSLKAALSTLIYSILVAWKIHRWRSDQVYSNTVTVCVGAFGARLAGRPHIWHLHEFGKEDQGLSFLFGDRFSLGIVDRFSSRCICVSTVLAKKYQQSIAPSKITVIYPSMQLALKDAAADHCSDSHTGHSKGRFRCVIVGALTEGKGQEESVLAFVHLKKLGLGAELLIVGEGDPSCRRRLEELITANALESQVTLVGHVTSSLPVMRSADAVLVCSRSEAFGRVTIEGMFAGKPVIGANRGATAELIKDGVNGLLYSSGDSKDLANKIKYLSENPFVAARLGKNARSWAQSCFTPQRYAREILTLLAPPAQPASVRTRLASLQ